ncbi:24469_t:CDS:2 [Gigaspora margarita]|uniref:24469_t:CDS:1 n=1 Tax=Gigaspora margarita TaxID=4874 RepID=A0ABN7V7M2_GIGMA|nr:24469_t:CDS:2 [Gigaspora margarita]
MATNENEHDLIELHDYPRKPEIEYRDPYISTHHYTIISEEYYPPPSILYDANGLQTIESWQSPMHAANLFAQPIESLSNFAKRFRIKHIDKKVSDYVNQETTHLYHKDPVQIRSLTLSVDNQDWIVDYLKDETSEKNKKTSIYVFRSLAKISSELSREYVVSNEKLNIDNIMQNNIPFYVTNININDLTMFATNNEEINIDNEEVIHDITESIRKASYRSIRDILKYIIPFYIEEDILNMSNPLIMLRILGDGRNVERQVKHVMITCSVLNDINNLKKHERHYTIVLYPLLKAIKFYNSVELYFLSNWKFLALSLGINAANAIYFCPYCKCTKKEIGLYNNSWDKKNMNDDQQYPSALKIYETIVLENDETILSEFLKSDVDEEIEMNKNSNNHVDSNNFLL